MEAKLLRLSKTLSYALRHAPWVYELELDEAGYVQVEDLLQALREERTEWRKLGQTELQQVITQSDKQRFEIQDGKIRAFYGHSVPQKLKRELATPPLVLYHGTPRGAVAAIQESGLKPMRRQYVHLSSEMETAEQVGSRRDSQPVILKIDAAGADRAGVKFYYGNEMVWLADFVPPEYISI